jgi:hypothetical protein
MGTLALPMRKMRLAIPLPSNGKGPAGPNRVGASEPATVATTERLLRRKQALRDRRQ